MHLSSLSRRGAAYDAFPYEAAGARARRAADGDERGHVAVPRAGSIEVRRGARPGPAGVFTRGNGTTLRHRSRREFSRSELSQTRPVALRTWGAIPPRRAGGATLA